jgi:hypothetical protein
VLCNFTAICGITGLIIKLVRRRQQGKSVSRAVDCKCLGAGQGDGGSKRHAQFACILSFCAMLGCNFSAGLKFRDICCAALWCVCLAAADQHQCALVPCSQCPKPLCKYPAGRSSRGSSLSNSGSLHSVATLLRDVANNVQQGKSSFTAKKGYGPNT